MQQESNNTFAHLLLRNLCLRALGLLLCLLHRGHRQTSRWVGSDSLELGFAHLRHLRSGPAELSPRRLESIVQKHALEVASSWKVVFAATVCTRSRVSK